MRVDDAAILIDSAALAVGVDRATIMSGSRLKRPSLARQIVIALWSEDHSLQDSVAIVGRTSHSLGHYSRQRIFAGIHGETGIKEKVRQTLAIYSQKKARPSQYLGISFFAELHGIDSPLNPQSETSNTNTCN
jgi:hypothetical protein